MQNHHNLIYREEEREMMPLLKVCLRPTISNPYVRTYPPSVQHLEVGVIPWSPIARGLLTRPWGETSKRAETDRWGGIYSGSTCAGDIIKRVEEIANKKGVKMAQISVAWSLTKVTAPIVGTTRLENLKEMIGTSSNPPASFLIAEAHFLVYRRGRRRVDR